MALQTALNQGIVGISGTGDYENVRFESLISQPIAVEIARTSIIAPTDNSETSDLANLPLVNTTSPDLDQDVVWEASGKAQLSSKGWTEAEIEDAGGDPDSILSFYREGWSTNEIKGLGPALVSVSYLLDDGWTKAEVQKISAPDLPDVADLADAGWSASQVQNLSIDIADAASLARSGWGAKEVASLGENSAPALALSKMGLSPEDIQSLGNNMTDAVAVADWTTSANSANISNTSFYTVLRIKQSEAARYFLFTPKGSATAALGNTDLDTLATRIRDDEADSNSGASLKVVISGQGDQADFDAVQMTLADVDAGGGRGLVPLQFAGAPPDFPPRNGGGKWDEYRGPSDDIPVAYFPDGRRTKRVPFLTRGDVLLTAQAFFYEKWPSILAYMRLGVRDAETSPGAATLPADQVLHLVEDRIDARLQSAKKAEALIGSFPDGAFTSETTIDKATSVRRYAEIEIEEPEVKVATTP